ncbi:MAG TPA: oligosaccharide flippase family protein [Pyrinomonadaceae bacterium]
MNAPDTPPPARRRSFSMQVAWTLLVRVLMAANSIAAGIIVARWLGAAGLGTLAVLNVTVAMATNIGSMGLPSANTYFIAQDRRRLRTVALNALVFALVAGSALAAALVVLVRFEADIFGEIPLSLFALAAISIPFQLITLLGLNIFLAVGHIERFNLLDVAGQSFVLVNALVALVVLQRGLWALVSLNTTAAVGMSLLVAWLVGRYVSQQTEEAQSETAHGAVAQRSDRRARAETTKQASAQGGTKRRETGRGWRLSAALFRQMMNYGLKIHLQTVASLLLFRVDLLIVKLFRGAAEAGVYSVASQVALMLMLLPGVIATLLFPRVAEQQDERGALAARVTRHAAFVMLLICAAAVPAVFALPWLYGAAFAEASLQSLILLPGVFLVSVGGVLAQHFSGTGLPIALPLFWTATLLFNTALNLALVPAHGARGAAFASSLSYSLIFALIAFYFRAQTGNSFRTSFLLRGAELREMLSLKRLGLFS